MQSTRSARATWRAPALLSLAIAAAMMAPAPAGAASAYNPETGKTARYTARMRVSSGNVVLPAAASGATAK